MMTLDEFLEAEDALPFVYGGNPGTVDCLMRCADWAAALTGKDPAAGWRGTYSTAAGAWRIVTRAGGMVAHVAGLLEPLGWRRTDTPDAGDIGVVLSAVSIEGAVVEIGAIRYGPRWSMRAADAVLYADFETVAAWTLSKA